MRILFIGRRKKSYKMVYIGMKNNQQIRNKLDSPLYNPKQVQCESCDNFFALKFVIPRWDWSVKNNLDY
jgi:hypothetical protein